MRIVEYFELMISQRYCSKIPPVILSLLLFSCTNNNSKKILDYGVFTIETPTTWKKEIGYGTFSTEVGSLIMDNRDTARLDVSIFSNSLTEIDSVIIMQNNIKPYRLNSDSGDTVYEKPIDLDKYRKNNIAWEMIDGIKAKIVYPRQPGSGTIGVYFEKINDNYNSMVLYGENIDPILEQQFIRAIKTIKFHKGKSNSGKKE